MASFCKANVGPTFSAHMFTNIIALNVCLPGLTNLKFYNSSSLFNWGTMHAISDRCIWFLISATFHRFKMNYYAMHDWMIDLLTSRLIYRMFTWVHTFELHPVYFTISPTRILYHILAVIVCIFLWSHHCWLSNLDTWLVSDTKG